MTADRLDALLESGTTGHRPLFPGAVLGLDVGGARQVRHVGATQRYADEAGTLLPVDDQPPVTADTLYDLASVTKVVTALLVVTLAERGRLALDEPLFDQLDDYPREDREAVTVRRLLTHTSGLPADSAVWRDHPDVASRRRGLRYEPVTGPGGFRYSCTGYLLLGQLVEQLAGPLDELVQSEIAGPLGLTDLGYRPLNRGVGPDRIAATEVRPVTWSSLVDPAAADTRGIVHDEKAASLDGVAGNAGLFGTAADLLGLGRAYLDLLAGRPSPLALSPAAARSMVTDPAVGDGFGAGLGWRVDSRTVAGPLIGRGRTYSHPGFTGTSLVVDEDRDLVLVLLTNRVHPSRTWSELGPFRQAVAAEVEQQYRLG